MTTKLMVITGVMELMCKVIGELIVMIVFGIIGALLETQTLTRVVLVQNDHQLEQLMFLGISGQMEHT